MEEARPASQLRKRARISSSTPTWRWKRVAGRSNIKNRIIGASPTLRDALRRLERFVPVHGISVLIEGETGTGKELAAQLLHEKSRRHVRYPKVGSSSQNDDHQRPSSRQRLILRYAEKTGRITRQMCAETTSDSIRTASRDLASLVRQGLLVPDGRPGKAGGYVLAVHHPLETSGPKGPGPITPAKPVQPSAQEI